MSIQKRNGALAMKRKHEFRAQEKRSSRSAVTIPATFSDDSVDDFSDTETPCRRKVTVSRKNMVKETAVNSNNLAVQKTKTRQVVEFVENWDGGKNNQKKLLVIAGPPGCGKTTLVNSVVQQLGRVMIPCKSLFDVHSYKESNFLDSRVVQNTCVDDEDWTLSCQYQPLSVEECCSNEASFVMVVDNNVISKRNKIRVDQLCAELEWIAEQTVYPTIVIITYDWSASSVGKNFEKHLRCSNLIQWLSIHPVTRTEMQKALSLYCKTHDMKLFAKEDLNVIIEQCQGDLRNAIAQLQLYFDGQVSVDTSCGEIVSQEEEDQHVASLDICHAIGKIFYNKRIEENGRPKDSIRSIVASLDESSDKVIGYIMQNCYQFYSDIGDMSDLMSALCEALEVARWYNSALDREIAQQCSQIIAGEAARVYNRRPLQRGFQPIHSDMYSNVSIRQVGETNSSYLVDDIRRKIYFREIIPCLTATKWMEHEIDNSCHNNNTPQSKDEIEDDEITDDN